MAPQSQEHLSQLAFDFSAKPEARPAPAPLYRIEPGQLAGLNGREAELGRFVRTVDAAITINTPRVAAEFLQQQVFAPFELFEQEELVTLMLNTKNRITHEALIYRGTINAVYIRPAEIFRPAIRLNALAIILAHNHPSGLAEPSSLDVRFTENIVKAGELLEVNVLDHIIVGRDEWVSLRERKLGFG